MFQRSFFIATLACWSIAANAVECSPEERRAEAIELDHQSEVANGWVWYCQTDFISSKASCGIVKHFGDFQNPYSTTGGPVRLEYVDGELCYSAAMNDDPRFEAAVRVDSHAAIRHPGTLLCGRQAQTLRKQMLGGKSLRVRAHEWPSRFHPSGTTVEYEADLEGFAAANAKLESLRKKPQFLTRRCD